MMTYSLGDEGMGGADDGSLRNVDMFGGDEGEGEGDGGDGGLAERKREVQRLVRGKIEEKRRVVEGWREEVGEVERKMRGIEEGMFPVGF